jgi:DNA-binding NtrC family response regulator
MLSTVCYNEELQRQAPLTARKPNHEPVIFVVEDDSTIRRFLCTLLRRATKAFVAEAGDPYIALSMARAAGGPIDLLISDINLSTFINGIDLACELAVTNPSMKVLLISGTDSPEFEIPATWRFLAKPFTMQSFLDCVNALCRPASSPVIDNNP